MGKNLKEAGNVVTTPLDAKKGKEVLIEDKPAYFVHVDADRDGKVDDVTLGLDKWQWGKGKKGAIVLVNNNRDGAPPETTDNSDTVINGASDLNDVAPIEIRRRGSAPAPAGWTGKLSIDPNVLPYVRIFESRDPAAKQVMGTGSASEYSVGPLDFEKKELGIEAVEYPKDSSVFDGTIELKWTVNDGKQDLKPQKIVFRVAPWIIFNHFQQTKTVYVVDTDRLPPEWRNTAFRSKLATEVSTVGASMEEFAESDRWMQDVMELGFSSKPSTEAPDAWATPVVLRSGRVRGGATEHFPLKKLLSPEMGYTTATVPAGSDSLDSFGNLECSPPVTVGKKVYPFGRIVYGDGSGGTPARAMNSNVVRFLKNQAIQAPFSVDTSWLEVGHVDEVFSFCPMKGAPKKFKVLIASPQRAWSILEGLEKTSPDAGLFSGIDTTRTLLGTDTVASVYPHRTVKTILADAGLKTAQKQVQKKIDGIQKALKRNLGLEDADFVPLPVLFHAVVGEATRQNAIRVAAMEKIDPSAAAKLRYTPRYIAYTPGVVNMLVLTKSDATARLVIPKPFGPVVASGACEFEKDIETQLSPLVLHTDYEFVEDFFEYHVLDGEIHCGTNSLRVPPTDVHWWEQEP
ncbi:protein-arginine deiminase family protein [Lysobacter sp. Root690]|uniref:protein-arginine deiminase family protein n=1 Tax=Lysobacter sp. Root690 TaxID=1736588 RepID=UPI0006FDCA3F|nr:protein-arginine deiminase family protein [Lysobacter sp. Root690]KRB04234.1 hypothetical protein ASD86_18060 [Lysobacter sp. Root690]